jgi:hypothetical protein
MLSFGATMNCIPWVYVPEILPLRVRAKGTAVGISANWLWNFFVVMITPTLLSSLAWKGYLIFMCLNFSFIPLVVSFFCLRTRLMRSRSWIHNILVFLLSRDSQSYPGRGRLAVLQGRRRAPQSSGRKVGLGSGGGSDPRCKRFGDGNRVVQ